MPGPHDAPESAPRRGTRVRFAVLAFTVALAAVTYLDRVCIAHADVTASIKRELDLSDKQMSLVYSAFTLAYALFEMPTGAWGDRIGSRRVLTRIVVWCVKCATISIWRPNCQMNSSARALLSPRPRGIPGVVPAPRKISPVSLPI